MVLNKPIDKFSKVEVSSILNDLITIGSVELGLAAAKISPDSNNKKVIDHILTSTIDSLWSSYSSQLKKSEFIIALLDVYFNAGVTFVMR